MTRAIEPDGGVGRKRRRELLPVDSVELRPERAVPSDEALRVVAAEEIIVGDVEVARAREVGEDAESDVLEAASLDGKPLRAGDEQRAGPDGDVGVADGHAFEVVVVTRLDVEQVVIAAAVEDDFAVASALDD